MSTESETKREPGLVHPRLSVHELSTVDMPFPDEIELWKHERVPAVGLDRAKTIAYGWDSAMRQLAEAGFSVNSLSPPVLIDLRDPESWPTTQQIVCDTLDRAAAVSAPQIYMSPGRAGGLTWEELLDRLAIAIEPCVIYARSVGVRLAIETSSQVRTDVCFVNTLRDGVDVADVTGLDLVVDLGNVWMDRDLRSTIARAGSRIASVQVADFAIGTLATLGRCVPGDGDIPIATLLSYVLETGYSGRFELEALGPAIEAEGYSSALHRGIERVSEILYEIGV